MAHHRAAAPRPHPTATLGLAGAALSAAVGAVAFSSTASASTTGGLTTAAATCDRQVSPDHLDLVLAHAAPGEVVCVPGTHSARPASSQGTTGSAQAPTAAQPRLAPTSDDIGSHRTKRHARSQAHSRHDVEEFTVSDLLEHTLGPYL
jgi:hypothetical protein